MASASAVLRKKKDRNGNYPEQFPLAIQIVHNRIPAYKQLGKTIAPKDWDPQKEKVRRSHPHARRINSLIIKKLAQADAIILDFENTERPFSSKMVKQRMDEKKPSAASFFDFAIDYFETMRLSGNYNRLISDISAVKQFKWFLTERENGLQNFRIIVSLKTGSDIDQDDFTIALKKGADIRFDDITVSLLEKFKAYLKGKKKLSERTIFNYLAVIRAIYKQALKDNTGVANEKSYPFGKGRFVIKKPESQKIGLEKTEVRRIEDLDIRSKPHLHHTKNIWLFAFYFAGMRAADVYLLKWSDFKEGRLYYIMEKNNKPGSVKIPEKAQAILDEYREQRSASSDLVFPDLRNVSDLTDEVRVKKRINLINKRIDKHLKEIARLAQINKKLSMHIARHSFGTISGDRIPIQMLQLLYRHSSITTTVEYQKAFINKGADDALDQVLDF